MSNQKLTIEQIRTRAAVEGVTLYQLHRFINDLLVKASLPEIKPQMVYNYARQGMIVKGQKITNATAFRMTLAEADEAAKKFADRRIAKATTPVTVETTDDEVHPDQLALEI